MISDNIKSKITTFWDDYIKTNKIVLDTKGKPYADINESRLESIEEIKIMIHSFLKSDINIFEFKTLLDSYNKRHNLWGFTATKGQMFFNQLTKNNDNNIDKLTTLLKQVITEPKDLNDALGKIESLENFSNDIFSKAKDKRKAPNPGSVGYFLSYFWQIYNNKKWPIMYTSLIISFKELGIWEEYPTQKETYSFFYNLNEEAKEILKNYTKSDINNWDVEHAFWTHTGIPVMTHKSTKDEVLVNINDVQEIEIKPTFDINDYLIPKIKNLVELGNELEKSSSAKGSQYERLVAEIFKLLGFEVEILGQGSGRNPDAIIKFREENIAFIVDAKAYSKGYTLGTDDRAIREYINDHCPKLQKDGYKKIGFIIVSNSFKPNFDSFINDITWRTDVKRFILLKSEALLYLLAYKTKDDKLNLTSIIDTLISLDNPISAQNIIESFDDV